MTKSFNCASCSAPLEFGGSVMQKCEHCGSTVIAPHEMFYAANPAPFGDLTGLSGRALKFAQIQRLIHDGKKIEAIKVFREAFGTGLKESKDAVEAMQRGESVDVTALQMQRREREAERMRPRPQQIGYDFKVDPEAVKGAAKKVGAGLAVTVLLFAFIVIGVVGILAYFAVDSSETEPAGLVSEKKDQQPAAKSQKNSPAQEVLRFGGEGNGPGRFKDNRLVAVDGNGRIYSSDYSPFRIQVFDSEGKFINQWKPEEGTNLYDLEADREGNLYVVHDRGLFKFEGETGKILAKAEKSYYPRALALTWDSKVVATNGKGITIFDTSLKPLNEIKDAAERASSTFGFDMLAVDGDGIIYAKDRTAKEICKFSPDGRFLDRFEHQGGSPNDIAIDPRGRLYISDTSRIYIVDPSGKPLLDFDARQAFGLSIDRAGALYVASRPLVIKYLIED